MKESELRQYCLEHAGEKLTPEAEALLAKDPELKEQVDQLAAVQKLISLKRYEQPSPDVLERCLTAVNEKIESKQKAGIVERLRDWVAYEPVAMQYGYATAAVILCIVVVGLFLVVPTNKVQVAQQDDAPAAVPAAEEVAPVEAGLGQQLAVAAPTNEAINKPIIVMRVNSNQPANQRGMTIGGNQVMPVSFEK